MRPWAKSVAAWAIALLATTAAAGCGETKIDVGKAAKSIDSAVETQVGAKVRSVACPDDVEVQAKATFTCVITGIDGTKGEAVVTQQDDEGNMTFRAPFLQTRSAEQIIQKELRKQSRGAVVSCPEIIVVAKGGRFDCEAMVGKRTRTVSATQTDAGGNFTYRLE